MRGASVRPLPALSALLLFAACASPLVAAAAPAPAPSPAAAPRLVVFLVVDGLPQRQVLAYRSQLAPDGLARFLDRGAWFANAHYGHAYTVTAPGHASMLTGTYAYRHGIIGNEWRDPRSGEDTTNTADERHVYIGHKTGRLDGTSPKNLRVETVGDMLRRADARAKVIGISGKDRGAILPAGKTGTAYIYMQATGAFASSTYYMPRHPGWVEAFNAAKPADRWFKQAWKPVLDDPAAYAASLPDEQPWFSVPGKLPMTMGAAQDKPDAAFYSALLRSPFVDAMALDFARAAIRGESLGQDEVPDILAISLSGHDWVNHAFSAESRLSHDHLLQLDRLLQAFFRDLDAMVGKDRYLAVLTADHGFMPAPEVSLAAGRDAGRLNGSQVLARVNAGLSAIFGAGTWVRFFSASAVALDRELIAARGLDRLAVQEQARRLLLKEAGIAAVYTGDELAANAGPAGPEAPLFGAMRKSWFAGRSADLQVALKPYWMLTSSKTGTTHGSPHAYDTNVPLLFWGPNWIGAGAREARVEISGVAPTLARILRVPAPPASEGSLLPVGPER